MSIAGLLFFGVIGFVVLNPHNAHSAESTFTQVILPRPQAVAVVDEAEQPITQPTIALTPKIVSAVLGTPQQRLRIMNPTRDVDWSVTIAPSEGPGALWQSNVAAYDVNDQGVSDGPDEDTSGGKLTIDPSHAQIQSIEDVGDCPATGLSLGSLSSFDEYNTAVSSITLLSGSAVYTSYCGWDVTGIRLQQVVPSAQPDGTYVLHLTITII